ncbi:MAG: peptidylprolyl isomerase [Planctomycetota bacterium]|nr:peptidylprolyl isomerase [Planctomycetota bacterium]
MLRLSRRSLTWLSLLAALIILPAMQAPPNDTAAPSGPPDVQNANATTDDVIWSSLAEQAQAIRKKMQRGDLTSTTALPARSDFSLEVKSYLLEYPDDVRAWNLLASLCGQLRDDACVDRSANEILRIQPENVQAGLQWAAYYATLNKIDRALEVIESLLARNPTGLMYHNAWIVTATSIDPMMIEPRFQAMLAKPDTIPHAIAFITAMRQSDPWTAQTLGEQLLEAAPDDPDVIFAVAFTLRSTNQFAEAKALLGMLPDEKLAEPKIAYLYSDCHYADHHFERAYEIMSAINLDAIDEQSEDKAGLKRRLTFMLPLRETAIESWEREQALRLADSERQDNPQVRLMIDGAPVEVELFQSEAPNTVAAFLALTSRGHYDETPFGQVQTGFRSIGGTIPGLVPYTLPSECKVPEARHFFSGTLATYLPSAGNPDSAHCEWCIYHFPAPHLNQERTVFGRVISGMDTVRAMQQGSQLNSVEIIRSPEHDPNPIVLDADGQRVTFSEAMSEFNIGSMNDNATP